MGKQTAVPFDQDTHLDLFYHFFRKTIILQQKKSSYKLFDQSVSLSASQSTYCQWIGKVPRKSRQQLVDLITICISTDVEHIMSPPSGQLHLTDNLKMGWSLPAQRTEGASLGFPPAELGCKAVQCWKLSKTRNSLVVPSLGWHLPLKSCFLQKHS